MRRRASDENPYPMDLAHGEIAKPFGKEGDPYGGRRQRFSRLQRLTEDNAYLEDVLRTPRSTRKSSRKFAEV